jgi:SSS family solute:Na+ symporter
MTVFSSGISMYALGLLLKLILGWSFTTSVLCSAAIVLAYTFLGGLTSETAEQPSKRKATGQRS